DVAPERILTAGARAVTATGGVRADALPDDDPGPGIEIRRTQAPTPDDRLHLETVEFALEADHDLLATPDIFGLATVSDPTRGHFPGIAEVPLAVGQARQN